MWECAAEGGASALRHPGLDPGSSAIKSLIAKDSFLTAQTRRGWMSDQVRHDGGEVFGSYRWPRD
ncbi:hypothetical protein AGR5A_Cc190080 [Agrobacterium genomosp. 5 str. CFBP 6626]|nr:hypothetical protein AGR5A_Cc190080 [Agrobacterium genomosp. 5 str. CFBP 6626]